MRKLTKVLSVLAVMTATMFFGSERDVSAAVIPAEAITIDYDAQKLTVKENASQATDLQLFYAVPTAKSVKTKQADGTKVTKQVLAASSWDVYDYDDTNGVTIDLSSLNRIKDNYIQLRGSEYTDVLTIKIPAVLKKVSATFEIADAKVVLQDVTNRKQPAAIEGKEIEYRTAYSSWNSIADVDFSIYQRRGAMLYFRLSAHKTESLDATASAATASDMVDADGNTVEIYTAGSFPGVEAKLAIGKQAGAPKVKVNYVKQQFTLPKNTQYRVVTADTINDWLDADPAAAKCLNLSEISSLTGNAAAALQVRYAATNKKGASQIRQVEIPVPEKLSVYTLSEGVKEEDIVTNNIFYNGLGTGEEDSLLIAGYVFEEKTKKLTGIRFFNATSDTYEVYISKDGTVPTAASTGLKTIKGKKADSGDDAETTISTSAVSNGDRIYIRKKADTAKKIWSSDFVGLGTIQFDSSSKTLQ